MRILIILSILFSFSTSAVEVVSFEAGKSYRIEGTFTGKFFVFNRSTNNEQLISIKNSSEMVKGAQYSACLNFIKDCHMECEAKVSGKPVFITPDLEPALLKPNDKGAYAPADKTQCP